MTESSATDVQAMTCGPLRLEWSRAADRTTHRLFGPPGPDGAVACLAAVEGTPLDRWPSSPPYQQLSLEPGPGGLPRAFLVGMAGTSHWSAVVEAILYRPAESRVEPLAAPPPGELPADLRYAFLFDVACRFREPPTELSAAYDLTFLSVAPSEAASSSAVRPHRLPDAPDPARTSSDHSGRFAASSAHSFPPAEIAWPNPSRCRLLCPEPVPSRLPATLRWSWVWRWEQT